MQQYFSTFLAVTEQGLQACKGVEIAGGDCGTGSTGFLDAFQLIANTLIFVIGAIAVIMVIVGGLRYVLSNGDTAGVKSAKDTILYSLVGVVVSLLAYALVSFVIGRFGA